jgi:hypothetical protein
MIFLCYSQPFDNTKEFNLFKMTKYYPKTKTGNYLRRFGHRNAGSKIAVRNEDGGEVFWLPKTIKKSLSEEIIDGLNEIRKKAL